LKGKSTRIQLSKQY